MNYNTILLHLSLIPGVGPQTLKLLLQSVGVTSLIDLYSMTINDFVKIGIRQSVAKTMVEKLASKQILHAELALLEKHHIRWISFLDEEYPAQLKEIYMPPIGLYVKGDVSFNHDSYFAIVGSRKAHNYARRAIDAIVPELVSHNFVIVSGGAYGADTMAHKAALDSGGKTIAVLGSGILRPYPARNKQLFENIVRNGGALISAFPLLADPIAGNFPARNRIIAGLSRGCLVAQAAAKSGASITAQFALEQGRDVFAVPGPIDDPLSAGCHNLIMQGATLVQSADDILNMYDLAVAASAQKQTSTLPEEPKDADAEILDHFRHAITLDDAAEILKMDHSQMQMVLFDLQIQGKIVQDFAGLWQRV